MNARWGARAVWRCACRQAGVRMGTAVTLACGRCILLGNADAQELALWGSPLRLLHTAQQQALCTHPRTA